MKKSVFLSILMFAAAVVLPAQTVAVFDFDCDDVTVVERKKIDKVMASTVFRRIRTSTSRRQSRWERESVRTRTAAGKFYDIDSMPKMPLYANTFLGWKDKKVRENITVNNKNITLNGKNITVKVTQMQKCI